MKTKENEYNVKVNKIILFANQKGGVGKTTLCGLFSNYLVSRGVPIVALDADLQQTLFNLRKSDEGEIQRQHPDEDVKHYIRYVVRSFPMINKETTYKVIQQLRMLNFTSIIDTPGSLSQDTLAELLANCDYIICPYLFDINTIMSTRVFAHLIYQLKKKYPAIKAQLIFICNRKKEGNYGSTAEKKAWDALETYFKKFGIVVPARIGDYKSVMGYNTIENSPEQGKRVNACFDYIFDIIYGGKENG